MQVPVVKTACKGILIQLMNGEDSSGFNTLGNTMVPHKVMTMTPTTTTTPRLMSLTVAQRKRMKMIFFLL